MATSLARSVSGLPDRDIQRLFHALKREGAQVAGPSELDLAEWRERQADLLDGLTRVPDKRRDHLHHRLFATRGEPVPDAATFYAWSRIEARARQEAVLRAVPGAIDLDPPGSQADDYTLGPDGRPTRVWYASYGSNLLADRLAAYIQGGRPPGSSRTYSGCTDPTPPTGDIPIRFTGARPHFALTSAVWGGGIAFMDPQDDPAASSLGRAYNVAVEQFDQIVAQENGATATAGAPAVSLQRTLADGRDITGPGAYQTLLHIGDYQGAPVLTFTAPFTTRDALARAGRVARGPATVPVRTNKPSAAYVRMIGQGLGETFGLSTVAQADYLRGCPGGDRWTRRGLIRALRSKPEDEPTPPAAATPEIPAGYAATPRTTRRGTPNPAATTPPAVPTIAPIPAPAPPGTRPTKRPPRPQASSRSTASPDLEDFPAVARYRSLDEQRAGAARWHRVRAEEEAVLAALQRAQQAAGRSRGIPDLSDQIVWRQRRVNELTRKARQADHQAVRFGGEHRPLG